MSNIEHQRELPLKDVHKVTSTSTTIGGGGIGSGGQLHERQQQFVQRGRDGKESFLDNADQGIAQMKMKGNELADLACDVCTNWRHYPKLLTVGLLLLSFLMGGTALAGVQRIGGFSTGNVNFVATHWDRETADVHHALDVMLDHLQHPALYRNEKAESYVKKARNSIMSLFDGVLPSSLGRKSNVEKSRDFIQQKGRNMYDDARDTGRNFYDKAADVKEGAYEFTHNIGDKISDMADSVKNTFAGRDSYDDHNNRFGINKDRRSSSSVLPSWLGGSSDSDSNVRGDRRDFMRRGRSEEDEFEQAADKLQHVMRSAKRDN